MKKLLLALALFALAAPARADLKVAIVEHAAGTGTPPFTQDFTDSGAFGGATPKGAICSSTDAGSTDTSASTLRMAVGALDGTREGALSTRVGFSTPNTLGNWAVRNDRAYVHVNSSGNVDGYADGSLITNGIRLTWGDQSNGETIRCLIFAGDIEFGVEPFTPAAGTSAQAVTHRLTGAPQLILAFGVGEAANTDSSGNIKFISGAWSSSGQVGMGHWISSAVSTTASSNRMSSTTAANENNSTGNFAYTGTISNVTSSTFDLTNSFSSTDEVIFVSIRATSGSLYVKTGTFTARTTTGTAADVSGMSGAPQALLTFQSQLTAVDTGSTAAPSEGIGFGMAAKNSGSSTTQYGTISSIIDDNVTASATTQYQAWSNTRSLYLLTTAGATDLAATVQSWDSGGVTHNYGTVSGTAYLFGYAAIGASVTSTPTYSSDPAIQSRSTSSIVVRATVDTTGTRYGARLTDGSATPTCDQLEAQTATGGVQYASQATTATVASDLTLSSITSGTVTDYYECTEDGSGNDSAVKAIANVYKTPAFSAAPSCTAASDVALTCSKTLDGPGTVLAVACPKDATAPDADQTAAQEFCGDGVTEVLGTGSDDATGSMTVGGSLVVPVVDAYFVGTYGGLLSAVQSQVDECLNAPTGKQVVNCPTGLTSIHANSPINGFNTQVTPDIAAGDIPVCDAAAQPCGSTNGTITYTADGLYEVPAACTGRQTWDCNFYDLSAGANHADTLRTVMNNASPNCSPASITAGLTLDAAMTAVDFATFCGDAEGDTITCTSSDTGTGTGANKRPAGTSITSSVWSGTPTAEATGSFTMTCADPYGASDTLAVSWEVVGPAIVPDCDGLSMAACLDQIYAQDLEAVANFLCSAEVPAFDVISQSPAANEEVTVGDTVTITVGRGPCGRLYKRFGLGTRIGM